VPTSLASRLSVTMRPASVPPGRTVRFAGGVGRWFLRVRNVVPLTALLMAGAASSGLVRSGAVLAFVAAGLGASRWHDAA
jgi:hypothetical protein